MQYCFTYTCQTVQILIQHSLFLSGNIRIYKNVHIKTFYIKNDILNNFNQLSFFIVGGKNCSVKKKHRIFPTAAVSVMIACFTTISGLFLILYLGLHYCVKKQNPIRAVFWRTIVCFNFKPFSIQVYFFTILKTCIHMFSLLYITFYVLLHLIRLAIYNIAKIVRNMMLEFYLQRVLYAGKILYNK